VQLEALEEFDSYSESLTVVAFTVPVLYCIFSEYPELQSRKPLKWKFLGVSNSVAIIRLDLA